MAHPLLTLAVIGRRVSMCAQFLTKRNVAHNVFFTRAQPLRTDGPHYSEDRLRKLPSLVTVYVFPRRSVAGIHRLFNQPYRTKYKRISGAKPPTNFSPASCELAGCLTSYSKLKFLSTKSTSRINSCYWLKWGYIISWGTQNVSNYLYGAAFVIDNGRAPENCH